jgi:predicted outer membrane protein
MSALKQTAAALALCLAAATYAQTPAPAPAPGGAWPSAQQQRRGAQAAQPAQQPAQPSQPATGSLTDEQKSALGAVWVQNQIQARFGDLAAKNAASQEVKDFANWISKDHKTLAQGIWARLTERGTSPSTLPSPPDRQQLEGEAQALASRSGEAFDYAFVAFMKQHGEEFVDALKRARDVTAGSDPVLKKYLDQAEDAQEAYLTQARQLDARRVQARTPPAR